MAPCERGLSPSAQMRKPTSIEVTQCGRKWQNQDVNPGWVSPEHTFSPPCRTLLSFSPASATAALLKADWPTWNPCTSRPLSIIWQERPLSISAHQLLSNLWPPVPATSISGDRHHLLPLDSQLCRLCFACTLHRLLPDKSFMKKLHLRKLVQWRQTASHASLNMVPDTYFEFNKTSAQWKNKW